MKTKIIHRMIQPRARKETALFYLQLLRSGSPEADRLSGMSVDKRNTTILVPLFEGNKGHTLCVEHYQLKNSNF